ncbi:unnamed protein product, partial [Nesidiocoris tenuis]
MGFVSSTVILPSFGRMTQEWVGLSNRFFNPEDAAVIREVYDNENAHDVFAEELERALDASAPVIVIEPHRLGDETARWIAVGNCLHKTAVITGIGAVAS